MDSSDAIQIAALLFLLLLSAFFSSAETSLTTVNKIRIQSLAEQGNRNAKILEKVISDSSKMLSTILIGNNIVNISASSLATTITLRLFGNAFVSVSTGILTLLVLIFGEITPKTMATIHSEKIALSYARIIYALMVLFTPLVFIVQHLSFLMLRLLRVDPNAKGASMTEHELRTIVNVSQEDGVIESEEKQMIYNVFDFRDSVAKDIMIPRIDMTFVDINCTYEELMDIYRDVKYTRFPVFEDNTDNVIGTINVKDLLLLTQKDIEHFSIRSILREPYFTYEHKSTADLLLEMRESSYNLAIVLDEYGATAGLVTTEDLLEEIVGEIRDEYDEGEDEEIRVIIPEKEYIVDGSSKLDDISEALQIELESEDYDSIGGYIIEHLDSLPAQGQGITLESGIRLVADVVRKKRIEQVHIYLP
ncbi:MAG: HlyC/CorC family transporter [Lachnospiraceae bacterium]|nr:hemolysin family protein [Lachnospiraceae bacterium]MDY4771300.1 hemolysin family protein [Lachnospiraceae bacterium]